MCNRNELLVSEMLKVHSKTLTLLYFIAMRAWRGPGISPRGCGIGEALIGDYSTMGMSEQEYRTVKKHLKKMGFITTKSTSKGTIAKLINTELFDPNFDFGNDQSNGLLTSKQRTANGQATTNNNCKNSNNWNKRHPSNMNGVSNSTMPVWKKIQVLEDKIEKHPTNRESVYSTHNPTSEQKADFKELKKRLRKLKETEEDQAMLD
jgi:hypothetical protein